MDSDRVPKANIANTVTLGRLLLGIPIIIAILLEEKWWSIGIYVLFLAMDVADGWLARKFNCSTTFGKNFDFITDGIVGGLVMVMLFYKGLVPVAYIVLIAIPLTVKSIFIWKSTRIARGTFIPARWRKLNGAALFLIPLCFMSEDVIVGLGIAYILLAYVYASSIKYIIEVQDLAKKKSKRHSKRT